MLPFSLSIDFIINTASQTHQSNTYHLNFWRVAAEPACLAELILEFPSNHASLPPEAQPPAYVLLFRPFSSSNMSVPRLVHFFENRVVPRDIPSCITVTGRVDVQALVAKYDAWTPFADDQDQPHAAPAPTEGATAPATSDTISDGMDVRSLIAMYSAWSPLADDQDQPARSLQPSARQHYVLVQTEHATQPTAAPVVATAPAATEVTTSNVPDILVIESPVKPKSEVVTSDKSPALLQAVTAIKKLVPTATRIPMAIRIPAVIRIPTAAPIVSATLSPTTPAETAYVAAHLHPSARSCLKAATFRLFSYEKIPGS